MRTRIQISTWVLFILVTVCSGKLSSQVPFVSGGAGAPAGNSGINNIGGDATGLGCGGGGGSWWGGTGGSGKYGGGGAGAGGYSAISPMNWAGGDGGQGVVVIAYYNGASFVSSVVLISGTFVTVGSGITSAKVWAIGGGGGGGGATENDGTAGGSGAAGGVAYVTKAVTDGSVISYTLGSGGRAGHGAGDGTAGGATSVTIAGTTIYGYGGGGGFFNSNTTATGGSYSGGDGGATGGSGYARVSDVGGGGGGAIGGANGTQAGQAGGTGANSIDVSGLASACASATISDPPVLTSFTPNTGLSGTSVVILGTGFTGATAVKFGGENAASFTVNSSTQITAVVASGHSGSTSVTLPFVTVSKPTYYYQTPVAPVLSSFSPSSGPAGTVVSISGSNLANVASVSFGGTPAASFVIMTQSSIMATVGNGSTGTVSITSPGGTSTSSSTFTYFPPPSTQAFNVTFSSTQLYQTTVNWTNGNGDKRIVFMKAGNSGTPAPVNNTTYSASTVFGSGSPIGTTGWYCIYNNTGSAVTVTGLASATTYRVMVLEYSGSTGSENYQPATATDNPNNVTTLTFGCTNPSFGGTITNAQNICTGNAPAEFTSTASPSGESGTLEYRWQSSVTGNSSGFNDLPSSSSIDYQSGTLTATTWFRRLARVNCMTDWTGATPSNVLEVTVNQPSYVAPVRRVSDLQATGQNIQWYASATGGTALATTDVLANGHYYASQTVNGVESTGRFDVTITVDPTPCAPTANSPQTHGAGATIAQLTTLTGQNIRWYDVATGGSALPSTTLLQSGTHTYYATQTIDCTESASRLAVTVTVN